MEYLEDAVVIAYKHPNFGEFDPFFPAHALILMVMRVKVRPECVTVFFLLPGIHAKPGWDEILKTRSGYHHLVFEGNFSHMWNSSGMIWDDLVHPNQVSRYMFFRRLLNWQTKPRIRLVSTSFVQVPMYVSRVHCGEEVAMFSRNRQF